MQMTSIEQAAAARKQLYGPGRLDAANTILVDARKTHVMLFPDAGMKAYDSTINNVLRAL